MNTIIAIPFDEKLAEFIGKKGSENSITFYNRKVGNDVIVALMPSSIDEKFYALPQSMLIADQIVISTVSIDKLFGEALVASSLLDKPIIFTKDNDIANLLVTIKPSNFSFCEMEGIVGKILSKSESTAPSDNKRIDIDKAFNVKGIGTVVLGVVTKGTVKVHDTLYHNSGKQVMIRSIQSQDQDIKEAGIGTRVGLALKGIEEEDMGKGDILSNVQAKSGKHIEIDAKKSAFVNESIEIGKTYSLATGFSYSSVVVEEINGPKIKFKLEKVISAEIGDQLMLVRTIAPRIFASGKIVNISE